MGVLSNQGRMSVYMVILQNVVQHSGEGVFILFDKIPVPTIELPDDSKRSLTYAHKGPICLSSMSDKCLGFSPNCYRRKK